MHLSIRNIAAATSLVGVGAFGMGTAVPSAFAATPHITPANTKVTGKLKSGTTIKFNATVAGFALTVNCTKLTASGTTPANGLTVKLPTPPKFTGCTDSLGGTDTVTTSGAWSLTANSTGSSISLAVPVKGATFVSSLLTSCKITVAPTAPAKITGKYDNKSTWTISNSAFAIKGTGCTTSATSTATATVVFTPGVSVTG